VPLVLTAIASAPDLAVEVTVFGASRAIPTNYLHVVPEPAAIDWLANGVNYFDVVARAVDEAGGQAFATDSAGPLGEVEPVWTAAHDGLRDRLLAAHDPATWIDELVETGVVPGSDIDRVFRSHVVDGTWDDPLADELALEALPALTEELVDRVIAPRERVQALFAAPYVTRLSTTIDPAEMTVDPQFALVEGLPDVPVERIVEIEAICDPGPGERRMAVVLPDGRRLDDVPTLEVAARRIERLTRDGEVQVLVDNGRVETDPRSGASCSITPVRVGFVAALLGLGLVRRRVTTKRS
jgi:hypothetical protein